MFQFGDFQLDCGRFELLRNGRSLRIERKPMELLMLLASSEGQLVTRTEIAKRLWDSEVFVDTEHGINTAIRKIRNVLRDDPENPRFVQTVTGMGYRFIAPITVIQPQPDAAPQTTAPFSNSHAASPEAADQSLSSSPSRRWIWLSVAATAVLAVFTFALLLGPQTLADRLLHRNAGANIHSLAVLPLDNLSGDPGQEYFADGMTDELITMLAKNSTLRIVSRTSVMQYKGAHRPVRDIAAALGVDGILEGSISRAGNRVHMTIQLIRADTDAHIWAESYDRDTSEAVVLPNEAAQTIAKQLHSTVPPAAIQRYVNPAAHDAYLQGMYIWYNGPNEKAGEYFRKATELQPDYAPGWAGLAMYYTAGAIEGDLDPAKSLEPGNQAAARAIELDNTLAEGHLVNAASIFTNRWDWKASEQEIAHTIALDPRFAEAYHLHAKMLGALNRNEEAIAAQKKATELDPFSRPWALALAYLVARQYDAGLKDGRLRLELSPRDPSLFGIMADLYRSKGIDKEAADMMVKMFQFSDNQASAAAVQRAYQRGGYKAVVRWQLDQAKTRSPRHYVSPVYLAGLYAQLGDREKTLTLLEQGFREHSPLLLWIQSNPAYDFLHVEPRYRSLIQRIGLPPAW